jgi:hypothetical protein
LHHTSRVKRRRLHHGIGLGRDTYLRSWFTAPITYAAVYGGETIPTVVGFGHAFLTTHLIVTAAIATITRLPATKR